jgi:FMN reductase
VNSAAKNLVDVAGYSFLNKTIGFMASAGGESSYMALLPMINSMMLQHRTIVLPRFVYASSKNFNEDYLLADEEVKTRLRQLCDQSVEIATATESIMKKYE